MTSPDRVWHSALYTGVVGHQRFQPRHHAFQYRVFMAYIDLAELPGLFRGTLFWSTRPALAWFRRRDYLGDPSIPLDQAVRDCVEQQTGERPDGAIRLLTNLRYFGFLINPISCYYCFDRQERLRWIVAEVTNTPWKERTPYVIPCDPETRVQRHRFDKTLHVSPFMPMDMQYAWRSTTPGERLTLHLKNLREGREEFNATLRLERRPATASNLNRMLLSYPVMTMKVGLGIYWQALRLFLKRVPLHRHPPRNDDQDPNRNRIQEDSAR